MKTSEISFFEYGYPGITAIEPLVCLPGKPHIDYKNRKNYPTSPHIYTVWESGEKVFFGSVTETAKFIGISTKTVTDGCIKERLVLKKYRLTRVLK